MSADQFLSFSSLIYIHLLLVYSYNFIRADNYSTSEYVGFVDADCVFITSIDREDLFEDGKPVVNGRIGINKRPPWSQAPATTYQMTGLLEPMRCMSYFPVIIKTAHFVELRKFISLQHHNQSFNDIFLQMISNGSYYSQFNIMCTYLYHYHRQDYRWYVHDTHPLDCRYCMDKKWKGVRPKPNKGELWTGDRSLYEPYMFSPKGRVAVHARYHGDLPGGDPNPRTNIVNTPKLLDSLLRKGYCESPPFPKVTSYIYPLTQGLTYVIILLIRPPSSFSCDLVYED